MGALLDLFQAFLVKASNRLLEKKVLDAQRVRRCLEGDE